MPLGRLFLDLVSKLESELRWEDVSAYGTAGAMQKEAALNVAIRMGL